MKKIVIVGSGASGVHFALSVLRRNYEVMMVDVGNEKPGVFLPDESFTGLKEKLEDPAGYFLGRNYEGVVFPGTRGEYYGFPPNKTYVFSQPAPFDYSSTGFQPLLSFARGGLAEAWTGGVYPLNDQELAEFPFSYKDIEPFYGEVAKRILITGVEDDLKRFYPLHENLIEPLRLDENSECLLSAYEKKKKHLNEKLNFYLGRSRVAVASRDEGHRKGCTYKGRCLWGCPSESLYTPSITLQECLTFPNFSYVSGVYARYFRFTGRRIASVVVDSVKDGTEHEIQTDHLVLAAGTLSSARIFAESLWQEDRKVVRLGGLMDNRQIFIPFINLSMAGRAYNAENYQYHQLAFGIHEPKHDRYLHGLITTLKTALVHPILQSIPLDIRSSISLFRNVRAGLGLVNLNFPDTRRMENCLTIEPQRSARHPRMTIAYAPPKGEQDVMKNAIRTVKKALAKLHSVVPPGTIHVRPMGSSVHYAGTIPMAGRDALYSTNEHCRSRDFENLHLVDGSTFPSLPSKNLTFFLMANAVRVAHHEF